MIGGSSAEELLREKLHKIEALFAGAATDGEKVAAGAAADRIRERLGRAAGSQPLEEVRFSVPDRWFAPALHRAMSPLRNQAFSVSPDA